MEKGMFIVIGLVVGIVSVVVTSILAKAYEKNTIHYRDRDLCRVRHCLDCSCREYYSEGY